MAPMTTGRRARGFRVGVVCVLALMVVGLAGPRSVLGADVTPTIAFADAAALSLSTKPVRAQLVNNTAVDWELTGTAYLDIVDDEVIPREVRVTLPMSVAPGASVIVEVGPVPDGVTNATGFVVVTGKSGAEQAVARRALTVGPSVLKPRVEKWTASNQSLTISGAAHGTPSVSLSGPSCGSLGVDPQKVSLTSGSDIATLTYHCVPASPEASADAVLVFDVGDIQDVGLYTGTAKVGDTSITLSYTVAKSILWAILVIAVGLWLSVWRQVRTSAGPIRRADKRAKLIGEDALLSQDEFADRAGSASYRVYDFRPGVMQEVARLQTALTEWWPRLTSISGLQAAFGTKNDEWLDAILKDAASLDAYVEHWPKIADDLKALAGVVQAIDAADASSDLAAKPGQFAEQIVKRARSILAPTGGGPTSKPLTLEEAKDLSEEIPKLTSALTLLPILADLHAKLEGDPPGNMEPEDAGVWFEARRIVRQARAEFAVATDVAMLEKSGVDRLVKRARALYRQVAPPIAPDEQEAALASLMEGEPAPEGSIPIIGGIGRILIATWSHLATRSVDLVWLVVAILLAFWSGLTLYWFDKPWGRWTDVVVLLVWAFGTATVLTPMLSALEDVVARPTALKRSDDDKAA